MKKKILAMLAIVAIAVTTIVTPVLAANAPPALKNQATLNKLVKNAKGKPEDVIKIATTQKGYKGVKYGGRLHTWFTDKTGTAILNAQKTGTGAWCSEFATWCLTQAKVPGAKMCASNGDIAKLYKNAAYKVSSSQNKSGYKDRANKYFKNNGLKAKDTLTLGALKKGDILIIDHYGNGLCHTVIFDHAAKVNGKWKVYVVEGNNGNIVKIQSTYEPYQVGCAFRPNYNK